MLIGDELYKSASEIQRAVASLLAEVWNNQSHTQDLLLIEINGYFNPKLPGRPIIGPELISHAMACQHQYIDWYRKQQFAGTLDQYLEHLSNASDNKKEEEHSVHHELLVYQKFWELDMIQKVMYQLSRLIRSESYDWLKSPDSDAKVIIESSLRHFRKPAKEFYDLAKNNYNHELRNAIAHSTYFFNQRSIVFLNDEGNMCKTISFEVWRKIIETTLHIHNELLGRLRGIESQYREMAAKNDGTLPVRIIDAAGKSTEEHVELFGTRPARWVWSKNLRTTKENTNGA